MVYPKFIIENDNLILGKVKYHKQLATDPEKVIGGGWFRWNDDKSKIIFHGTSQDFGKANLDVITPCIKSGSIYTNKFKTHKLLDIKPQLKFGYDVGYEIIDI